MKFILSIDGGGIKGLIPAVVLQEIERRVKRPLHKVFDLMAGTSTGAIIAVGLAMPVGMNARDLVRLYIQEGPDVFRRPRPLLLQLKGPKYRGSNLYNVLHGHFGDRRLSEARTLVMTSAYDLSGLWDRYNEPRPVLFKSWRPELVEVKAADAVQASAAAPGYFPPHQVEVPWKPGLKACLYDGGLYAGDPTMIAYAEALREFGGEDIFVLSLGTGEREVGLTCGRAVGLINIGRRVHSWMLDGSTDTVSYIAERVLPESHYFRFDPRLDRNTALDDASTANLEYLDRVARQFVEEQDERIEAVCSRLTSRMRPI